MRAHRLYSRVFRLFVASFAAVAAAATAQVQTVNTYSFTQPDYAMNFSGVPTTGPGTASGSFTGTVNALGIWQASDLSAFSLTFSFPTVLGPGSSTFSGRDALSLFTFNTGTFGGLDIIASQDGATVCIGASATLAPACNPGGLNPADTLGSAVVYGVVVGQTTETPVVTLISSVTSARAVPEPATWAMMLLGFGAIGVAMRRRLAAAIQLA